MVNGYVLVKNKDLMNICRTVLGMSNVDICDYFGVEERQIIKGTTPRGNMFARYNMNPYLIANEFDIDLNLVRFAMSRFEKKQIIPYNDVRKLYGMMGMSVREIAEII